MYINQLDSYSCGPVAIHNALHKMGIKDLTGHRLKRLRNECKLSRSKGTHDKEITEVLKKERGIRLHKVAIQPSYEDVLS
jgi:hypothetical protein